MSQITLVFEISIAFVVAIALPIAIALAIALVFDLLGNGCGALNAGIGGHGLYRHQALGSI